MNRPARARRHFTIHVDDISGIPDALVLGFGRCLRDDVAVLEERILGETAHRMVAELVDETDRRDKVVDGQFKAAWTVERTEGGWDVPNDAPYSGVIELGRRPGRPGPPYEPIREWVEKMVAAGRMALDDGDTIEGVAHAIRAAIHKNGTAPTPILRETASDPKVGRWIRAAAKRFRMG